MNNKLISISLFTLGAAIGGLLSWKIAEKKYSDISKEEIQSVKDEFSKLYETPADPYEEHGGIDTIETSIPPKDDMLKYVREIVDREDYSGYSGSKGPSILEEREEEFPTPIDTSIRKPYIISPEKLGDEFEHDVMELYYYADKVLADPNNELVTDIQNTVGEGFDTHFGEFEEDSVCVRNERLKCDFEILQDERTFSEALAPYQKPAHERKPHEVDE